MSKKTTQKSEIVRLNDFQHSRMRTEMYLSSRDPHSQVVLEYVDGVPTAVDTTWVPALFTAYRELIDNAADELVSHKAGDRIDIEYNPRNLVFTIADNGRGIPIGFNEAEQMHEATLALTVKQAGRNFSDDRGATRGLNGVGASVVNYCSEYFKMEICRDGKVFKQRFREGKDDLIIDPPTITDAGAKRHTGTKIEFKLSSKVFKHHQLPESFIRARAFELALCYPKLKVYYNGERVNVRGGAEKVLFQGRAKPIHFDIKEAGFHSQFWLMPEFFADGSNHDHGLVNAIPLFNGGVHIDTFRRLFFAGMITALERESRRRRLTPNRSDFADGMLLYNITEMDAPSFDSQSKTRLINEHVGKIVSAAMADQEFFKGVIKRNPEWIESVYKRCAERTQKQDARDLAKLAKQNKKVRVAKLKDATHSDRRRCSLYITEGDSAVGGLVDAREAEIHAAIPLKGKVMNVHGMTPKQIYANEELARMMNAIGLVPGQKAVRAALRYGRVYFTCDADEDGKSITGLLTNFFFLNWPELFDPKDPFFFVFDTPLIIAARGRVRKYWYADNVDTFDPNTVKGWEITRAKGLAQLAKEDWKYCLANPKGLGLTDDGNLGEALDLLFNKRRADDRKELIGL